MTGAREGEKAFVTLQAQFALLGRSLKRVHRAGDGRISYVVENWRESRPFTHLHDLQGYLTQLEGAERYRRPSTGVHTIFG